MIEGVDKMNLRFQRKMHIGFSSYASHEVIGDECSNGNRTTTVLSKVNGLNTTLDQHKAMHIEDATLTYKKNDGYLAKRSNQVVLVQNAIDNLIGSLQLLNSILTRKRSGYRPRHML